MFEMTWDQAQQLYDKLKNLIAVYWMDCQEKERSFPASDRKCGTYWNLYWAPKAIDEDSPFVRRVTFEEFVKLYQIQLPTYEVI